MSITLSHIPTSEEDLEAQVDQAFNGDEPELEPKPKATGTESDEVEAEYIPPSETVENVSGYVIQTFINPLAVAFGVRPLDEGEVSNVCADIAVCASHMPKMGLDKMSKRNQAFAALGITVLGLSIPRVIEVKMSGGMRDVTPQGPKEKREETFQEGEPLNG